MIYDAADRAVKQMNRQNLKAFGRLKLAKWDEISLIREVGQVYDASVTAAKQHYYEIASEAFIIALLECRVVNRKATMMSRDWISPEWVMAMLEEADPVTLYVFMTETERKKQRLIETLAVAQNRNAEIDKALRYWTMQIGQYADNSVYNARVGAFRAAGVERVRWDSMEDDRVCHECDLLDGQIFAIEDVPPPQHYGCRCILTPILED